MNLKQYGPVYRSLKWSRTCSSQTHLHRRAAERASRSHKLLNSICQEASIKLSLYLGPELLSLVVTAEDNNIHDIQSNIVVFSLFGFYQVCKRPPFLFCFVITFDPQSCPSRITSWMNALMSACVNRRFFVMCLC